MPHSCAIALFASTRLRLMARCGAQAPDHREGLVAGLLLHAGVVACQWHMMGAPECVRASARMHTQSRTHERERTRARALAQTRDTLWPSPSTCAPCRPSAPSSVCVPSVCAQSCGVKSRALVRARMCALLPARWAAAAPAECAVMSLRHKALRLLFLES